MDIADSQKCHTDQQHSSEWFILQNSSIIKKIILSSNADLILSFQTITDLFVGSSIGLTQTGQIQIYCALWLLLLGSKIGA